MALIGIIGVLAIGILAIVLGFTGSNSFIDNIRDKIPGLQVDKKDGWTALDDPSGGFIAQMPEGREKKFVAFAPAANGRLDQWSSVIGNETDLTISYGKVTKTDGQSANAALAGFADTWATTLGGKIEDTNETGFQGYPAIDVSIRDLTYERPARHGQIDDGAARRHLVRDPVRVDLLRSPGLRPLARRVPVHLTPPGRRATSTRSRPARSGWTSTST